MKRSRTDIDRRVDAITARAEKTEHGFLDLRDAADEIVASETPKQALSLARALLRSPAHQTRAVGTFVLGRLAAAEDQALEILREGVSEDEDWRVQEILAQAFDRSCADRGYEASLPIIREWLADSRANVRRAVSEGLRIWTGRPYFKQHPEEALAMLSGLRSDPSKYVRTSAGNAIRDISRKYRDLVARELAGWDMTDEGTAQTHKLAARLIG